MSRAVWNYQTACNKRMTETDDAFEVFGAETKGSALHSASPQKARAFYQGRDCRRCGQKGHIEAHCAHCPCSIRRGEWHHPSKCTALKRAALQKATGATSARAPKRRTVLVSKQKRVKLTLEQRALQRAISNRSAEELREALLGDEHERIDDNSRISRELQAFIAAFHPVVPRAPRGSAAIASA
jgi:hypothetical protein